MNRVQISTINPVAKTLQLLERWCLGWLRISTSSLQNFQFGASSLTNLSADLIIFYVFSVFIFGEIMMKNKDIKFTFISACCVFPVCPAFAVFLLADFGLDTWVFLNGCNITSKCILVSEGQRESELFFVWRVAQRLTVLATTRCHRCGTTI